MSARSLLRSSYLFYFSQPAGERALYKAIAARPIRSLVEIGIDMAGRTARLLEVAAWRSENLPLRYTGIDLFESRGGSQPGLSLKQAFAALRLPNVRVQLVPGDAESALRRVANSLGQTDLLVISRAYDRATLERSWIWLPRLLTASSLVFVEEPGAKAGQTVWQSLAIDEVQRRAAAASKALRRAA